MSWLPRAADKVTSVCTAVEERPFQGRVSRFVSSPLAPVVAFAAALPFPNPSMR